MLVYWCLIDGYLLPLPTPQATVLGVSVLDDEGLIRAWEIMQAQVGSGLVPSEGAREWIEGLPCESCPLGVNLQRPLTILPARHTRPGQAKAR